MTRTVHLSEAVRRLDLSHGEVMSFLALLSEERRKGRRYAEAIRRCLGSVGVPPVDELTDLTPVTGTISANEVSRGRAFLRSVGVDEVAASLGFWEGTGADFFDIPLDEGLKDFVLDFTLSGRGNLEATSAAKRRLLVATADDVLLRREAPPKTLNPGWFARGASPVRGDKLERAQVPRAKDLHPVNYVVEGNSGRRYSILDKSDWPDWEALHDAGSISEANLMVFTAHSVVPDDVSFLGMGEVDAFNAQPLAEMERSAAVDNYLEYLGDPVSPRVDDYHGPAWDFNEQVSP
jgi:hypothetical protein